MGKEWLYRGGGGGGKPTKKGRPRGGAEMELEAATPGCMCAVFQLFDLHHFQFPAHHPPSLKPDNSFLQDDESTVLKGVEAPRNSLELEETNFMGTASLSSTMIMKEEENLNIPMGIQIKTSAENRSPRASTSSSKAKAAGEDVYSECSSSSPAGTKTPNLVARLMGLDLLPLPESGSPSALSISSRRHFISNSTTNSLSHILQHHPQGQSQYSAHRSRQFLQSRGSSCTGASRSSFFDTSDTSTTGTSGTLSLPETPRISSASRRSDVDHHRLSLQINVKEKIAEEFELSLRKEGERRKRRGEIKEEDANISPAGHYARQIVKQVRESASRKVGADITNTIKSREDQDHVVLLKPKKSSSTRLLCTRISDDDTGPAAGKQSCSPRLRFLDPKNKPVATPVNKNPASNSPRLSPLHLVSPALENQSQIHQEAKVPLLPGEQKDDIDQKAIKQKKCKKLAGTERYINSRLRKPPQASDHAILRNQKEEPFIIRSTSTNKANISSSKKKKKSLSNELFKMSVPTLLQVKKLDSPPHPRNKLPPEFDEQPQASEAVSRERRRNTRLSSCSSRAYINLQEEETRTLGFQENIQQQQDSNGTSTSVDEEYRMYIEKILKRTGIVDKATPVSQAKWFSQSHPLDPSIFHYIELFHPSPGTTINKLTRKLIFQLVDELLVDILKPNYHLNLNPLAAHNHRIMDGSELIETLCARIGNFPAAHCQVLEDIDAVIEKDLRESQHALFEEKEEEGDGLVSDMEREIVESLVHETAMVVLGLDLAWRSSPRPYSAIQRENRI